MKKWLRTSLSQRQYELIRMLAFEYKRWRCRISTPRSFETKLRKLQLGSGQRKLQGWLNVDMVQSDLNLDIASGMLPFSSMQFDVIIIQHVVEHLSIADELIPLFKECHRVLDQKGSLWISTPDMQKIVESYIEYRNSDMVEDRMARLPRWSMRGMPSQQFMNDIFHQQLEHRNLFDFELLKWILHQAGFTCIDRGDEKAMLRQVPDIPARNDDYQSLYVIATKGNNEMAA